MNTTDTRLWIFFGLGLVSLLLLAAAIGQVWRGHRRLRSQRRLQELPPAAGEHLVVGGSALTQTLSHWPVMARYAQLLVQAGVGFRPARALAACGLLALGAFALAWAWGLPPALALVSAVGALTLAHGVLLWRRHQRMRLLELQLPEALSLIARAMQAGHAFGSALQMSAQESPPPIGVELQAVFSEIQYGQSPGQALVRWAERVNAQDVRIFVTAVRIQSETGGNLAQLLHQTSALMRERQKLRGTVRVLSAEGRISALILTLLPLALAGLLTTLNPEFMAQLWTDPIGQRLLTLAAALMAAGMVWMWRLARLQD